MIYLSSFLFSEETVRNPNIYPYNVFAEKAEKMLLFQPITILYGNNASGKSTMLNIMANKLQMEGLEYATNNKYGNTSYFMKFVDECKFTLADDEEGRTIREIPRNSRYIKSEDILYEIKKIQQEQVLGEGYIYEHVRRGMTKDQMEKLKGSYAMQQKLEILKFAQEKYSNGQTTLQMLDDFIEPDALYLLDEPEVSLSPENQTLLAEKLNKMARFLGCQFIIATHSPIMLGALNAKIYNIDSKELEETKWTELENVRYFFEFFEKHRGEFAQ
ncbi:MAG: AAA family ATPase [bacterium]|nr:AAA family ATPase [bacterium]MDY4100258.1 AAA family ATPase [Lachnospiraceae bacterium]